MKFTADIAIIGTYGLPVKHGGFETFAEHISEYFASHEKKVLVIGDSSSRTDITYKPLVANKSVRVSKRRNPILFYLVSLIVAYKQGTRIVIMTGVGGALFIPLFKLMGMKILIMTMQLLMRLMTLNLTYRTNHQYRQIYQTKILKKKK